MSVKRELVMIRGIADNYKDVKIEVSVYDLGWVVSLTEELLKIDIEMHPDTVAEVREILARLNKAGDQAMAAANDRMFQ